MTYIPPPEPPSRDDSLGFDEFLGIFVAIAGIGAILFWILGPKMQQFGLSSLPATTPSPSATLTPALSSSPSAQPPFLSTPASRQASTQPSIEPSAQPRTGPIVPIPVPYTSGSSAAPSTASSVDTEFSDVSPTFWAAPFIAALSQRGILAGFADGTFRPNALISRAEVAVMLQKAFDQPETGESLPFSDVPTDHWARSAIASSVQTGFMRGYPGDVFRPEQQIPKVQLLIALASGLNLPDSSDPAQVIRYYQDSDQIPQYAIAKIAAATEGGLVVNYPDLTTLMPEQTITRADAAALIYQALVKAGKADKISSNYIVQP